MDLAPVPFDQQALAAEFAEELRGRRLEVCKVPGRDGEGFVRAVIVTNPEWYSWICEQHVRPRRRYPRPRTVIRRAELLRILDRMAAGLPVWSGGIYFGLIIEAMKREGERR